MVKRQSSLWLGTDEMPTKEQQTRGVWSLNSQVLESLLQDWALSYWQGIISRGRWWWAREGRKAERKKESKKRRQRNLGGLSKTDPSINSRNNYTWLEFKLQIGSNELDNGVRPPRAHQWWWVGRQKKINTYSFAYLFQKPKTRVYDEIKEPPNTDLYTQILECTTVGVTDPHQPRQTRFRVLKILTLHLSHPQILMLLPSSLSALELLMKSLQ